MGDARSDQPVHARHRGVEPVEEARHLGRHLLSRWSLEVDMGRPAASVGAGDDLHAALLVRSPLPNLDRVETLPSIRKQHSVPSVNPLRRQRGLLVVCGVQHHLRHPLDLAAFQHDADAGEAEEAASRP